MKFDSNIATNFEEFLLVHYGDNLLSQGALPCEEKSEIKLRKQNKFVFKSFPKRNL